MRGEFVQALEPRQFLSVAPAAPINVVGQYTGTASLHFSPRRSHPPMSDPVSLTISSENPTGVLQGSLADGTAIERAVSGRINGKLLSLRLADDTNMVKDRGRITARVTPDGITVIGSLDEVETRPRPALRWHGRLSLQRLEMSIQQGPAPHNLLGQWVGTLSGTRSLLLVEPTQFPVTERLTLTVTNQAQDGSFSGTLGGVNAVLNDFTAPITGVLSGETLTIQYPGHRLSQPISATVASDWTMLAGNLDVGMDYDWESGSFSLQRVQWP